MIEVLNPRKRLDAQIGLLVQAIPYYNRRSHYRDQCFNPTGGAEDFVWTRYAFSSACLYPAFATDQEKMVRSTSTIKKRRLAAIRGPEELVDMMAGLEKRMTAELDSALAEQGRYALPDDACLYAVAIYPACENGGQI